MEIDEPLAFQTGFPFFFFFSSVIWAAGGGLSTERASAYTKLTRPDVVQQECPCRKRPGNARGNKQALFLSIFPLQTEANGSDLLCRPRGLADMEALARSLPCSQVVWSCKWQELMVKAGSALPKSHFTRSFLFPTWLLLTQSGGNVPVNHCLSIEERIKR